MSTAAELFGLVIANAPALTTETVPNKKSPLSCASTRTNSPGGSSSVSFDEVDATLETLAQRRRVRELVLSDLGVDLPEASGAPTTRPALSTVSACPAKLPPCLVAPRTPPVPAHTACVEKTPTCVKSVASASDVVSTSPTQSVTLNGGDASQRSPVRRPGLDASQRRVPRAQPLSDAALRTPAGITSPPLSIVSTRPATRKSCAPSHDASTRTLVTCPSMDVTTPALSIVSTRPAALKSATPCHDASTRSPVTCPDLKSPVDGTTAPLSVVSTRPAASMTTTPSQDASTRTPMTCPGSVTHQMQKSTVQEPSDVVKCWLLGVGSAPALSGEELAETLRAAAPEIYED